MNRKQGGLYAIYLALKECLDCGASHHITLEEAERLASFTRYIARQLREWLDVYSDDEDLFTPQEILEFNNLEDGLNTVDGKIAKPMREIL